MKNKIFVVGVFVLTFLASASTAYAVNYTLGYSAVDEREIRWGGGTRYGVQWTAAIATWNARGRVNIAPDTVLTYEDLRVSDVNLPNVQWTGMYTNSRGTDTLKVNTGVLVNGTNDQRQNTLTHELGHALGLAHSVANNIMYFEQSSRKALGAQDIIDYQFLWGN